MASRTEFIPRRGPRRRAARALVLCALLARPAAPAPPAEAAARPRVALALSGGGARGFAHVGVLRGLERCGVPIDAVAGTSIGAIVGGLYAIGYSPDELEERALDAGIADLLLDSRPPGEVPLAERARGRWAQLQLDFDRGGVRIPSGLVPTQRLAERLSLLVLHAAGSTSFRHLRLPLVTVATDLETGRKVVLDSGSVVAAIRASAAVPGVFSPVEIDGRLLADGGLVDNLPVDEARALGADFVIAVDVSSPLRGRSDLSSFINVVDQSLSFAMVERVARARSLADVVLTPPIGAHATFDFDPQAARALVRCGEEAADAACPEIRRLLGAPSTGLDPPAEPRGHVAGLRVRGLAIHGAGPATSRRIRRQFGPVSPDSYLELDDLERRLARIRRSGALSRLDVRFGEDAEPDVLRLDVAEAAPVGLELGVRHDDKVGTVGRVALTLRRALGPLRDLTGDVSFGTIASARIEAHHDRPLGAPVLAFLRGRWRRDFDYLRPAGAGEGRLTIRRWSAEAGVTAALGTRGMVSAGYRIERARSRVSPGVDPSLAEERTTAALAARAALDTSDGGASPAAGTALTLAVDLGRRALGGDGNHVRIEADAAGWLELGAATVLHARGRIAGALHGDLPELLRAVGGGPDLFPGYPRDAFRGDALASGVLGIRHRLLALPPAVGRAVWLGIEGGGGSAGGGREDLSDGGELLLGAAVRFAVDSRLGPIELGFGLNRHGHGEIAFSAGPAF